MSTEMIVALVTGLSTLIRVLLKQININELTPEMKLQLRILHDSVQSETERLTPIPQPRDPLYE